MSYYKKSIVVEISAPTKSLAERCGKHIARKIKSETTALLRLAEVKKANVGFTTIERGVQKPTQLGTIYCCNNGED